MFASAQNRTTGFEAVETGWKYSFMGVALLVGVGALLGGARHGRRRSRTGTRVDVMQRRIVFEAGSTQRVGEEVARSGLSRVLVVTTRGRAALGQEIATRLGSRAAGALAIAREHVPRDVADAARREAERLDVDAVLAIGGGSAIGLGKAVALETRARVVAIPTTYSGSE